MHARAKSVRSLAEQAYPFQTTFIDALFKCHFPMKHSTIKLDEDIGADSKPQSGVTTMESRLRVLVNV